MRRIHLVLILALCVGVANGQVAKLWDKSAASANHPSFMGSGNTELGFGAATLTLQPFTKIFERSAAGANYPTFMGTGNTERGLAFGTVGGVDRLLLFDRRVANFVYVLDPATGDCPARLDTTGFAAIALTGTLRMNDPTCPPTAPSTPAISQSGLAQTPCSVSTDGRTKPPHPHWPWPS